MLTCGIAETAEIRLPGSLPGLPHRPNEGRLSSRVGILLICWSPTLTFSYTLLEQQNSPWKRISHAPVGGESQLRAVPESSRHFGEIMAGEP